jgi:hypothetical protein
MNKLIAIILSGLIVCSSSPLMAREDIQELGTATDQLYRVGAGAHDGAFTALSMSMLGWGLGLGTGIAILAAVIHQSNSSAHQDSCD